MDQFENPFWDLTQIAAWAMTREPAAARFAADPANEEALFEVRAAYPESWRKANEQLWTESGWPKPNDPRELSIEIIAPDVDIPLPYDERRAQRIRKYEAEGKIRVRQENVFPIFDYLALSLPGRPTPE